MDLSKKETNMLKGIAIIFLVFLHLFNTKDYVNLFTPLLIINKLPLVYYFSLTAGSCVSIFLFCSGYGLAILEIKGQLTSASNVKRIMKLLLKYWIILLIFVTIGWFLGDSEYPGGVKNFLLNFFLISKSYNGAWWFLQTYILLLLSANKIIHFIKRSNSIVIFLGSGLIYLIFFFIDIKVNFGADNFLIQLIKNYCLCQFSFILGAIFVKEKVIGKLYSFFKDIKYVNILCFVAFILLLLLNVVIENYIIDPLTAILIIVIFKLINKHSLIEKVLLFLSKHSTNIWLTHMFFYMTVFRGLAFKLKYPLLILVWVLALSIFSSYIIDYIYNAIVKLVINNRKQISLGE